VRTIDELETGWHAAGSAPRDEGTVRLICLRKGDGIHETPDQAEATARDGLLGDRWAASRKPGSDPAGATAITLINATVAELIAAGVQPLHEAGDNIHVDLDIGVDALPPGSRLAIGDAILRVSEEPHTGCSKFRNRFGLDALKWVSTPEGRARRLRGMNCSVVQPGRIRIGDPIRVLERPSTSPEPDEASALV
jgi:MOSC domain-containing protein YiiM